MVKIDNNRLTQRDIKSIHLKQIYLNALKSGSTSRQQLKKELHLSTPSVCALVNEFLGCGLLEETGIEEVYGRGRPCTTLTLSPKDYVIPIISLRNDGFDAFLFDICANLIYRRRLCVNCKHIMAENSISCPDASEWVSPILNWLKEIRESYHPLALLMSLCGSIYDGYFSSSVLHIKVSDDFLTILRESSGLNVIVGNNASFFAYGEKQYQKDNTDFIFVVIENGVGAGIIREGEIFGDGPIRAGEIGHISIDYQGRPCICGSRGCLERYISIPSIMKDFGGSFEELCNAYKDGSSEAVNFINEKAVQLAIGINNILCMHPTKRIVLGGQVKSLGQDFLDNVRHNAKAIGMKKVMEQLTIEYATCEENGDIYGALWNYIDHILNIDQLIENTRKRNAM